MEYIRINKWPTDAAKKAYENEYYIEAIQTLHGWLENQARSLLSLVGSAHFDMDLKESWELTDRVSFYECIKILRIMNQITKEDYIKFNTFNSLRNNVIHNYFKEPYEKIYYGIPKNEYDEIFTETLIEGEYFTRKNEEIIEIKK